MDKAETPWIALIRAIGPATHKKMSMRQLRDGCVAAGFPDARTYIATGNVLFRSHAGSVELKRRLAAVIASHGLDNDVFLRQADELEALLAANPFPRAATERPNHVLAVFLDEPVSAEGVESLLALAGPERIEAVGRTLFIDYADGIARSKITPAAIERRLRQPGTARNMNTVRKLVELSRDA